jgi:hypothetical protein
MGTICKTWGRGERNTKFQSKIRKGRGHVKIKRRLLDNKEILGVWNNVVAPDRAD